MEFHMDFDKKKASAEGRKMPGREYPKSGKERKLQQNNARKKTAVSI